MEDKNLWVVAKFGGTSVSSLENWLNIKEALLVYQEKNYK